MYGQGLGLFVLHETEDGANKTDEDAQIHQRLAAHAAQPVKSDLLQVGNMNVRFAGVRAR